MRAVLPPVVTGAVVMLIGFNLAHGRHHDLLPVRAVDRLSPRAFVIGVAVLGRGFISRIAVFLGLVFGYLISWIADQFATVRRAAARQVRDVDRIDWAA